MNEVPQWVREWRKDLLPRVFQIVGDHNNEAESLFADKHDAFTTGVSIGESLEAMRSDALKSIQREDEESNLAAYRDLLDVWDGTRRPPEDIRLRDVSRP